MKLQKLIIHNIASIEDATIDFEAEPLASSEVFLITGKTGAGKTTILDAICLALFADTPRLDNTNMQGDTQDVDNTLKIDDPRQLMRRNTGEAHVVLTFTGSNGIHYEATWSVARARNKINGNIQSDRWQLKNLDTNFCLTRKGEIKTEIKTAIGLDFKQFCRTTLLAQGEFTRFLNSKDDEKAEILEKITGVDIYTKIGAKIYEISNQKKHAMEDAQRMLEGVHTLTDEEIAERKAAIETLETQYQTAKKQLDLYKNKKQWMATNKELTEQEGILKEELEKALAVVGTDDFKKKETVARLWNETVEVRGWLLTMDAAEQNAKRQQEVLRDVLHPSFIDCLNGLAFELDSLKELDDNIQKITTGLKAEQEKVPVYEKAQKLTELLGLLDDSRKTAQQGQEDIKKEQQTLIKILKPAYDHAHHDAESAKKVVMDQEAKVTRLEEDANKLGLPALRKQRDEVIAKQHSIENAKSVLTSLGEQRKERTRKKDYLEELSQTIKNKELELKKLMPRVHDAEIRKLAYKEQLERQKDTIDKFAKTIRQKLRLGDKCPVCGQSIEADLPHEDELAALVKELDTTYKKSEEEYDKLKEESQRINVTIETNRGNLNREQKAFDKDKSVENTEKKLKDICISIGINEIDDEIIKRLEELKNQQENTLMMVEKIIKEGEEKELSLKQERTSLSKFRKEADKRNVQVEVKKQAVEECQRKIEIAQQRVKDSQEHASKAENTIGSIMVGKWDIDWKENPLEFSLLLEKAAINYNNNLQKKQELERQHKEKKELCTQVEETNAKIRSLMYEWESTKATIKKCAKHLLSDTNEVLTKVTEALGLLKQAEETKAKNRQDVNSFLSKNEDITEADLRNLNGFSPKEIAEINKILEDARTNVTNKKALFIQIGKQLEDHRTKMPDLEEEQTEILEATIEEQEKLIAGINIQKGELSHELKMDAENKKKLADLISAHHKIQEDYQKWDKINQLLGDSSGSKFRKIAQSYVLTSLIHSANVYMKMLTDRYTLWVKPGTFVISLEDAYQGYVSRAASTISGGESFLVSLSLALALSDIGQRLAVDTLFIDEGFGTLSGDPLQNAVNTLRSLHSKSGRHVGIISHVEELQDRIPVQIQVHQEGNNSSSTIRIIP